MADLEKGTTVVIYQAPVGAIISDLAYNPKDGAVAAMLYPETSEGSLEDTLIYIPKDPAEARSVYCRRARNLHGMTFSNDGQFYFGSDGDLWAGTIEHDVSNFVLVAERHAPLAARETYVGTSASIGVTDVAAINDHLLVGLHRMGGTGMGALVLLEGQNELKEPETTDTPDVVRFANRTTKYMANMKHLQDTYGVHKLATSADQNIGLVTYSFENGQLNAFVLDSDGRVSNVAFQKANKD